MIEFVILAISFRVISTPACVAAAVAQGAVAEENLSENLYLGDLPVVLSATRLRQPLSETPAAVTVIDREMIRDSWAWDQADLFRLVPEMYLAYNVDLEIVPGHVVSYHGLTYKYTNRIRILVDGRSVYMPLFGWSSTPTAPDRSQGSSASQNPYDRSSSRHGRSLLLSQRLSADWNGSVAGCRVGSTQALGGGDSVPAYTRWDTRLARQFSRQGGNGEMAVVVQNLLNADIREFYPDNVFGRRASASLKLEF